MVLAYHMWYSRASMIRVRMGRERSCLKFCTPRVQAHTKRSLAYGRTSPISSSLCRRPRLARQQRFITLNVPNPYAKENDNPGAYFGISVNGAVMVPVACFTSYITAPETFG